MPSKDTSHYTHSADFQASEDQRNEYDLTHWSMRVGAIGSLQTISCIPVVAGDSIETDASIVFRLSPLRRNLYLDCMVDLFWFYIPHRHIYGDDWKTFIKAGVDEATTFGTDTPATDAVIQCLGYSLGANIALPRWLNRGYMKIWNNYFKDLDEADLSETYLTGLAAGTAALSYGVECCNLKRIWNTGKVSNLTTGDYSLPLSGGEVDLYQFAQLQGRLKTEQARDYYGLRYRDIMKYSWDSELDYDTDQRPELITRTSSWLSGYDVDATDVAGLGTFSGKGQGIAKCGFPSKFFPEHGALWLVALLRFPPIFNNEINPLVYWAEPTYKQIAGDPDVLRREPPLDMNANLLFHDNAAVSLGSVPYGQWYREHPSSFHKDYATSAGHPFISPGVIANRAQVVKISHSLYDNVFLSTQLKHWNCQGHIDVQAKRFIPDIKESIFAGTH